MGNLLTSFRIGTKDQGELKVYSRYLVDSGEIEKHNVSAKAGGHAKKFRIRGKELNATVCEFARGVRCTCREAEGGRSPQDFLNSPPGYPWQEI